MTFDLAWIHLPFGNNKDVIGFGLLSFTNSNVTGSILGIVYDKKEKCTIIDLFWSQINL